MVVEVSAVLQDRIAENALYREELKLARAELSTQDHRLEKEKHELQLAIEKELDRRSIEWSHKLEKYQSEEHMLRESLNDKFMELVDLLEAGRPPKTHKAAIFVDVVRIVTQLRDEAQKLKCSKLDLQEKIKELKAEKIELCDEKQRLKVEKEKLEQQLKTLNAQPVSLPTTPAIPAAFAAQDQAAGNKFVHIIRYPGVAVLRYFPGPQASPTSCLILLT